LLNVVNAPVLMAFTQAAAVLIITSQLPALLGFAHGWAQMVQTPALHWPSALFGLVTLALLMLSRRWRPGFPTVLVVVLATAAISHALGFEAHGGKVVGLLPSGLPGLHLPSWPGWDTMAQLVMPVLVITLVSFLETASSAKVDSERKGERWDQDQDLIGQGLGKMASGFSGAFATSSSFSRSALNLYAGAQTGWATIFSVIVVLLALLLFTPMLRPVPQPVLAAIVVAAVLGLLKPREFVRLWRLTRVEAVIAGVTFVVTLLTAPALYWGVLSGVLMSLSLFLYQRLHPRIIEIGLHGDGSLRDRQLWQLPPLAPRTYALRMDAALDFAAAGQFERHVLEHLTARPDTRHLCLFAQPINRIDATGTEVFVRLMSQLQARGVELHLVGLKLPVENVLRAAGALAPHPGVHLYRTDADALAALHAVAEAERPAPADLAAAAI
jgi:SulP family sulfate permease